MLTLRSAHHRRRHGAALILVLAVLVVLLGMAVLMVDLGYLMAVKSRVQSAADGASMAGALRLRADYEDPKFGDLAAIAIKFAELNQPSIKGVLKKSDIEIGEWDSASRLFSPGASHTNAVRVTVRRNSSQSSSVTLFLGNTFGSKEADLNVVSVCAFEVYEDEDGNDEMTRPFLVQ
ncbi:MAG TPA: pilus assembly protein TadG-related protein [Pirellulaceae bacterium]|nr:pilus assembly protein TadG-related protein [Pirellulaceae bacterium]